MSSALAMVLMATMAVPGNGPEKVSGEMEQWLDLSSEWKGIRRGSLVEEHIGLINGRLVELVNQFALPLGEKVIDEGGGRFRVRLWDKDFLGIYCQEGTKLTICFRYAHEGYPTSFEVGKHQPLLILHRVKPGK
ncbi:MAG TPA: hypothetical protein VN688_21985 [Gemmataceae bacterium]|nr:hypothetical protein [Gemmataceae bacterium]